MQEQQRETGLQQQQYITPTAIGSVFPLLIFPISGRMTFPIACAR
jgi:hypothetical protein